MPFHHQHLLSALVRDFTEGYRPRQENIELFFNFSGIKGQTRVSRHGLNYFSSRVTLVFACLDKGLAHHFITNLFKQNLIEIGELILSPESVDMEEMPDFQEEMKYICLSPLVITPADEDGNSKEFVMPDSDFFSDLLYDCTMNRMERSGLFSAEEITSFYKFQFIPDKDYLSKIHQESKKFARIYAVFDKQETKLEVRGYTLPFALYAHPKVQEFVFTCGLGEVTPEGYGMLDLANIDPVTRSSSYDLSFLGSIKPSIPSYQR